MAIQIKPKEQKDIQQAQLFLSQNDAASAKGVMLKYSGKNKSSEQARFLLSMCHAVLGEFNLALPLAVSLIKKNPSNIEYLKLLGGIYHGLQQYDMAIKSFNRALKINSRDFQTLSNIASSYKEIHKYDEAEDHYKQSLAVQPNQPDALTNYGLLMQQNAKLDEAITLHKKALQLVPNHPTAEYNLAYAFNEKGANDESLQIYMKVIEKNPYHVRALCDIAHVYGKLKQPENTLPYLERAAQVAPDDEHVHLNLGISHRMMKNLDLAENSLKRVLEINPDNQTAKYFLAIISGDDSISSSPDEYVQKLFDGYAETFDSQLINDLQYKTPELIGDMVKKHTDLSQKYNILDLGCGTGLAGIHLNDISEHMVGIDLSEKMLKKAAERKIYDELITTGIDQYYEAHNFKPDIVVSADVFVYIGDIASIFHATTKSLQDNGIFVFSTEDSQDAEKFILKDSGRFGHNEKYIHALADETGLKLIDNQKTIIRYELGEPIHGQVYLLQK